MALRDPDAPVRRALDVFLAAMLALTAFTWWKAYGEPQSPPVTVIAAGPVERTAPAPVVTVG